MFNAVDLCTRGALLVLGVIVCVKRSSTYIVHVWPLANVTCRSVVERCQHSETLDWHFHFCLSNINVAVAITHLFLRSGTRLLVDNR